MKRILVRGPNWTGDLVMSTPGFRALRAAHPGAWIALQLRPGLEALVHGAPWFDEVIPVRSYRRGAAALLSEGAVLRRGQRFDLGICIPDSFSSALLMRSAGVGCVAGFRGAGRGLLLHRRVPAPADWGRRKMVSREHFVLTLLEALGCEARGTQLELFTTPAEEASVSELIGAPDGERWAALAPGASYGPAKLWPATGFARVGDALARSGARVLLLGTPGEAAITARVRSEMSEPCVDLAGRLDLGGLKAVLRRASLLVCNDAGARHVAVAFGTPSVVLFGPTDIAKTDCNLEGVSVFESEVECRPCYRRSCPIDHRCMTRIEPEQVIDRSLAALRSEGGSGLRPLLGGQS